MLSEIQVGDLSIGPERRASNGVLTSPVLCAKRPCEFQLPGEVTCLFPPSAFDGSARMSVTLAIDQPTADALTRLEAAVAGLAGLKATHSAIRVKEGYSPTLKLKYDADRVQVLDAKGNTVPVMQDWRGLRLKAIINLRSAYKQAANSGLLWDLVAVQVLGAIPAKTHVFQ